MGTTAEYNFFMGTTADGTTAWYHSRLSEFIKADLRLKKRNLPKKTIRTPRHEANYKLMLIDKKSLLFTFFSAMPFACQILVNPNNLGL